ncbi:MAG: hypothetical protein WCW46_03390 [Candidatus Paceibacterota bacterium]|jgi:hypothetical protein
MDEIRFSQLSRREEPIKEKVVSNKNPRNFVFIKLFIFLVLLIAGIIYGFIYFTNKSKNLVYSDLNASQYYAVFLTNGQVYFGKPINKSANETVLSEVYYLQPSENAEASQQLAQPKFTLVKLGQEIHGPTDKLFINSASILFSEQLRNDSKVVESIKNYKN